MREKYIVRNNSMKFTPGGQCEIALDIVSKGGAYLNSTSIAEGEYENVMKKMGALVKELNRHRSALLKSPEMKEIAGMETFGQFNTLNKF